MAQTDASIKTNKGHESSQRVVDEKNAAVLKPRWLVADDTNVDLVCTLTIVAASVAIFVFGYRPLLTASAAATIVLSLRAFLPLPTVPKGLVLVTGGSSGIGAELCYVFASKGHDLVIVGREEEQLKAVAANVKNKFNQNAYTVDMDLSYPGSAKKLYDHVKNQGLRVDVLVNDAALGAAGDTMNQPLELVERMVTLNCITLVQLTQLFGRDMMSQGQGWILEVSSILGWMAGPGQNVYTATKHFVRSFTEGLSVELRAHPNIVLTQLMPGPVRTQFVTRAHAEETFIFGASRTVEEPKYVAEAGYEGLCKRKRMVFSSWSAAFTATFMYLLPRSLHLTLARLTNAPMNGLARASEPDHDQKARGKDL